MQPHAARHGPLSQHVLCSGSQQAARPTRCPHSAAPRAAQRQQQRLGSCRHWQCVHGYDSLWSQPAATRRQPAQRRAARVVARAAVDYAPSPTDDSVLQRPSKQELMPEDMTDVFGYPRDLRRRYDITGVLGAGSFGIVREAVDRSTGRKYACKTIPKMPKRGKATPRYLLKLQQEVDAMQQIGASFDAVYLRDVFEDDGNIHLVMELCTGGSILEHLKAGSNMTEADVARILRSVLRFIAQCHTKGIIYRDVKPDNFLFLTSDATTVKATDFGLSIRHWPGEPKLRSRSGTPVYMAPEVVLQDYDEQADVWSVGILMWQLLTGRFPFWDDIKSLSLQQVWQSILSQRIDFHAAELEQVSAAARDLLKGLLERDPDARLTPKQALEHPWIKEGGVASELPLGGSVVQRLQRYGTYGHLKQVVLAIIANEIAQHDAQTKSTLQQLKDMFGSMDENSSGALSSDELTAGLRHQGYEVTEAEFERLVERMDLNADGCIAFDEFAAGLLDWEKLKQDDLWSKWMDVAFSKLDSNGDGYISLGEIVDTVPGSDDANDIDNHLIAVSQAKRTLREVDINGDGRISKEEFHHMLTGSPVPDSLDQYDARVFANN